MGSIHPKVAWPAIVGTVITAAAGIATGVGHPFPSWLTAGLVAVLGAVTGYAAPSPSTTPANGGSITEVPHG